MDLVTLDGSNQPEKLLENYDSLIWTERFNTVGDFQLVTGKIDGSKGYMNLLPEGTRVSLRETNHVMVVETHQIDRKKNQPEKLIIKGRSFESILDRRISLQALTALVGNSDWTVSAKIPSDVAWYLMQQIVVSGILSPLDIFPGAMVQFPTPADYGTSTGPSKNFTIERGNLLSVVLGLLASEAQADLTTSPVTPAVVPHGIRALRPNTSSTAIGIQIYKGTDLSGTVYFDASRDLLDDGTYLFSKVGSANVGYGVAGSIAATMYEGAVQPSGLERRVTLVDASDSDLNDEAVLRNFMSQDLAEKSETSIFDGSINPDLNPYVYGVDYNLGDIVRIAGDYGLDEQARITEYIRTEDATGQKAFPTLETIVP